MQPVLRPPAFLRRWLSQIEGWAASAQREDQVFLVLTVVIGGLVGIIIVGFIVITEGIADGLYPPGSPWWRRLFIPFVGAGVIGAVVHRWFPEARGSGVPQTRVAFVIRDGYIGLRTVLGKFFCTAATLASGIPLGREGPSVQVGAGIASVIARRFGLPRESVRAMVPVGAASAVAAAFNTPVAAVLFALEELVGNLHTPMVGAVVVGSTTSWVVMRLILGNDPLFHVPAYHLVHPGELGVYAGLGILGGGIAAVFTKLLLESRRRFRAFPARWHALHPAVGGLLVGGIGLAIPQVLGVGYRFVGDALAGHMALGLMAALVVLKIVAVAVCYGAGSAGGIFGPSLFIGAMAGGAVGSVVHRFAPGWTAGPGAYALVGMGTAFAGIVRAPFTSVIMIFELTHDYEIIVPLMISNMCSFIVSRRLQPTPIYEALALQDGIHLPAAAAREPRHDRQVVQVLRPASAAVDASRPASAVLAALGTARAAVVARGLRLVGVVRRDDLAASAGNGDHVAGDLVIADGPHVHADEAFDLALERMGRAGIDVLPVVSRADLGELLGIVTLSDVLEAYGVLPAPKEHSEVGGVL